MQYTRSMATSGPSKDNTWLWIAGIGLAVAAIVWFSGRLFRRVAESLQTYKPSTDAKKETDHRKALAAHFRASMPEHSVMEEYGNERSRVDIVIGSSAQGIDASPEKIAVELKYRLKDKTEVDRLVGQCVGYRQFGYEKAVVVLIDAEPNMIEVLKSRSSVEPLSGFLAVVQAKGDIPESQPAGTAVR